LPTGSSDQASPRQPPTVSDTTAAALLRSTLYLSLCVKMRYVILSIKRLLTD